MFKKFVLFCLVIICAQPTLKAVSTSWTVAGAAIASYGNIMYATHYATSLTCLILASQNYSYTPEHERKESHRQVLKNVDNEARPKLLASVGLIATGLGVMAYGLSR